jgi:hypothetical protein
LVIAHPSGDLKASGKRNGVSRKVHQGLNKASKTNGHHSFAIIRYKSLMGVDSGLLGKRQSHVPLPCSLTIEHSYFLNFLLSPAKPTKPEPSRSMVVVS